MAHPETWLKSLPQGLFCAPGGFFIDPTRAVDRAVITHGHADHARPGHRAVLASAEIARLLDSVALFPHRPHVVAAYSLGKCQRLIALLRRAGWDRPIWLHPSLPPMCALYEAFGVALGDLRPVMRAGPSDLTGGIVLASPGSAAGPWLDNAVLVQASGWMRVRKRARAMGVELPLVISDHADWNELNATIDEVGAPEVWVTHGREDALIHAMARRGIRGRALRLVGYGDEEAAETAETGLRELPVSG